MDTRLKALKGELNARLEHFYDDHNYDSPVVKEIERVVARIDQFLIDTGKERTIDLNVSIFAKVMSVSKTMIQPVQYDEFEEAMLEYKPKALFSNLQFHKAEPVPLIVIHKVDPKELTIEYHSNLWDDKTPKTVSFIAFYQKFVSKGLEHLKINP